MNVRLLDQGWSAPRNDYRTYTVRVLFGSVRTGAVHTCSKCVHERTYESFAKHVEQDVQRDIGAAIMRHLLESPPLSQA